MQGLWLEDQTIIFRENLPVPEPDPGEALIRLRLAGICSTDLEMLKGYYDFSGIPGHEFVGEIVGLPEEASRNDLKLGQRVVGEINIVCGQCRYCLGGNTSHCKNRKTLGLNKHHGVFAEFLTLPIENLHVVPDSLTDEAALFTEPLAAALEIQTQIHVHPNLQVLLIGAGRLGQLIAQTLNLTGCDLNVVIRRQRQRDLLEKHGINTLQTAEILPSGYDLVVDATGSADGLELARRAVRPRGTIVLKSTFRGSSQIDFSRLVVDEITIVGSRCGPFTPALQLLAKKLVDPRPLIDDCIPLKEGIRALEQASKPGIMKIAILPLQK